MKRHCTSLGFCCNLGKLALLYNSPGGQRDSLKLARCTGSYDLAQSSTQHEIPPKPQCFLIPS